MRIALLTAITMVAFAANSLLCRVALGAELIDPVSFTSLRLISGACVLLPLARWSDEPPPGKRARGSWGSGVALFTYALAFSLAYVRLETGTGALILFGAVQLTMIGAGLRSGERPPAREWLGLIAALAGLVYLVSPGWTAPHPVAASAMTLAGVAWGVYSLRGTGVTTPVSSTAGNFGRTVPMALVASVLGWTLFHAKWPGIVLALLSGTVTSGLGYVLWYKALVGLTAVRAAIVQLVVPVLAAFGGVLVLDEVVSLRIAIAGLLILGGVTLAILARAPARRTAPLRPSAE